MYNNGHDSWNKKKEKDKKQQPRENIYYYGRLHTFNIDRTEQPGVRGQEVYRCVRSSKRSNTDTQGGEILEYFEVDAKAERGFLVHRFFDAMNKMVVNEWLNDNETNPYPNP